MTGHPLTTRLTGGVQTYDVIGDVHGCLIELVALLDALGYEVERDELGRPVDASSPLPRRVVFLGDLVDRGPDSVGVLRLVQGMHQSGVALALMGNHETKLIKALDGRDVPLEHGLASTLEQLDGATEHFRQKVRNFCRSLPTHLVLDEERLVVAHAGLREEFFGENTRRARRFALFGETTGALDEHGLPERLPWARDYQGKAIVLNGHTPVAHPIWFNNTMCLDTGCVFGGRLTALRYPELELRSIPAERVWCQPAKPIA